MLFSQTCVSCVIVVLISMVCSIACQDQDRNRGNAQPEPRPEDPTLLNTDHIETSSQLLEFAHRFSNKLLDRDRIPKSMVFSPLSIGQIVLLLALGARGKTLDELTHLFSDTRGDLSKTHNEFGRLINALLSSNANANSPDVDHFVQVSSGLFLQSGYSVRPQYRDTMQSIYRGETFSVDFRSSNTAASMINQWVKDKTFGKIKEIISKPIDHQTKLILATTLYLNARWKTTFFDARKRPFWKDGRQNEPVDVDMMTLGGKFPFYNSPENNCRIIALPYKNSVSTMFLIMPINNSSREAVRELNGRLNSSIVNDMISKMKMSSSIVFLPKMNLTYTADLKEIFSDFGVTSLFHPLRADLGSIVDVDVLPTGGGDHSSSDHQEEDVFTFSQLHGEDNWNAPGHFRAKRSTYKVVSEDKRIEPLDWKDFVLRKRITKDSSVSKKQSRHRRQANGGNPGLTVDEIVHKVDLVVNEKGTEGGAATVAFIYKTGTDVVFKAEEPFIFFIRHEASQLPLFYGTVFDPR